MLTEAEIIQREKAKIARQRPSDEKLKQLPLERPARVFGRLSDPKQVQESLQSMAELGELVKLAAQDGFHTELSEAEVARRISAIQKGETQALRYWMDGQLIVDLRDLGISGRLGPEDRPALAEFMADLKRGEALDVTGTIYLSSEGVSRLSRDQDRVVSAQLLALMKQANCRMRTPYRIYNPRIRADWRDLREGFEDAAKESQHLQEDHFYPRKRGKALKGEHVGTPVPPGFIIEIKGRKNDGSYLFGKWQPYLPHAEIDVRILQEYVRYNGSAHRAARALGGMVFPFFPTDLKYMETRSSLRHCLKTAEGYLITPGVIEGLAGQVALMGTWKWSDVLIENNHPEAVPKDLFRAAYEIHQRGGQKPKGRAVYFEPMDWEGLLWCQNHDTPRHISGHSFDGRWVCDNDYSNGLGPICLKISGRVISEPLTKEFLRCLDLSSQAEAVLGQIQSQVKMAGNEESQSQRQETQLKSRLANLESYLGSCDRELEQSYQRQIKQAKVDLEALQQRPAPAAPLTVLDIAQVRHFLAHLEEEWQRLSPRLRNRLLKQIIERVEIVHSKSQIEASVIWKTGFRQKIVIERPVGNSRRDRHWTAEKDNLLRQLWTRSSQAEMQQSFPDRSWDGITARAAKLRLSREIRPYQYRLKPWTSSDDARLRELYPTEPILKNIADEMGRSVQAVCSRATHIKVARPKELRYARPKLFWETRNFDGLQEGYSRI